MIKILTLKEYNYKKITNKISVEQEELITL